MNMDNKGGSSSLPGTKSSSRYAAGTVTPTKRQGPSMPPSGKASVANGHSKRNEPNKLTGAPK